LKGVHGQNPKAMEPDVVATKRRASGRRTLRRGNRAAGTRGIRAADCRPAARGGKRGVFLHEKDYRAEHQGKGDPKMLRSLLVAVLALAACSTTALAAPSLADTRAKGFSTTDLSIQISDSPDPVSAGSNLTYIVTASNNGPAAAFNVTWSGTLPAGTTFVSMPSVAGWSCSTPAVGGTGPINCTHPNLGIGSGVFAITVAVDPLVANGSTLSLTTTITATNPDNNNLNNTDTETTSVVAEADLAVSKVDTPDPVDANGDITYTVTVNNPGPTAAAHVTISEELRGGKE
jgi:uncharacterized repeat protein (TIGR01451 family)